LPTISVGINAGGFDYDNGETKIDMCMANKVQEASETGLGDER
jgi:hypothetical protein